MGVRALTTTVAAVLAASGLAAAPAAAQAPGSGCATHPLATGLFHPGTIVVSGTTASATITVDDPLCDPLPFTLATYSKVDGAP